MKIAKYFGEKLVFSQQSNMVIFPRAVVAALILQKKIIKLGRDYMVCLEKISLLKLFALGLFELWEKGWCIF